MWRSLYNGCGHVLSRHPRRWHPLLAGDPRYRALFDFLIAEKKRGEAVNGSILYLEHKRDLGKFDCRPSTVLTLAPGGEVFYPCLERGNLAGSLRRLRKRQP